MKNAIFSTLAKRAAFSASTGRLLALALWLCVLCTAEFINGAEPIRLRVLSYNIHHAEGVDRKLDVERIARVILSVQPDLVALQEVDRNVKRTGGVDQPAELARLTKMHVAFGPNIELQGGHYGNAILSRFPIKQHSNHRLPNIDGSEQRGVLEAHISISESMQPLRLLATHLDYRADERERIASAKALNDRIEKYGQQPALLAGDLNDTPDSRTLKTLAEQWQPANPQPLATVPVDRPTRQIDFVLVRPGTRWNVVEVKVLDEAVASDHRAILAVLELLPPEKEESIDAGTPD